MADATTSLNFNWETLNEVYTGTRTPDMGRRIELKLALIIDGEPHVLRVLTHEAALNHETFDASIRGLVDRMSSDMKKKFHNFLQKNK